MFVQIREEVRACQDAVASYGVLDAAVLGVAAFGEIKMVTTKDTRMKKKQLLNFGKEKNRSYAAVKILNRFGKARARQTRAEHASELTSHVNT